MKKSQNIITNNHGIDGNISNRQNRNINHIVYGLKNDDLVDKNVIKIGRCENYKDRISTYKTGFPYNSPKLLFVVLADDKEEAVEIEELLHYNLDDYRTIYKENFNNGGIEWFNIPDFDTNLIKEILKKNNYDNKLLEDEELKEFEENENRKERLYLEKLKNIKSFEKRIKTLKIRNAFNNLKKVEIKTNKELQFNEREYQKGIIEYGINQLLTKYKFYLELATGGGKSYIVYKILNKIKPNVIIIFAPRKKIINQNCSSKYISILNNQYLVYNCSNETQFSVFKDKCQKESKKMIIVACPQGSNEKVYKLINNYSLNNILIWFDESHNTIENWVNNLDDKYKKFFLENYDIIKNRIFTSASPSKKHIEKNSQIFGQLYSPIKVKELIDLKWLCPIIPHIFCLNKTNIDICNYNLEHFNKFNCKFGFSFHNTRPNAFNLFQEHYQKYSNKNTIIKPFLLFGEDYQNEQLNSISLEYDYRNIDEYEKTENSIGYIVQQYSMGYDFNKIDYIIFSDPKTSSNDIIQCIGRGIRPDGLGRGGQNLYKHLTIMLPVFIESEIDNKFNRIEGILRYLVYDIEYDFEKIDMNFSLTGNKKLLGKKYKGQENMKAILLDLLKGGKYSTWKYEDFIILMKNNKIHDREETYNRFIEKKPELNLPEDPYRCFPDFTWEQTYNESPYYSKEECKKKIIELQDIHEFDLDDEEEPEKYLNSLDSKMPPICLFRFYGGYNNNEYY